MLRFLLLAGVFCTPAFAQEPTLYGRYEHIRLEDLGQTLKAKMDTGAETASLSARDIERFEREGEQWVRFRLAVDGADDRLHERRLAGVSEIKGRAEEGGGKPGVAVRPLVDMEICIADRLYQAEVNLTDRSHFEYPLLIGSKLIGQLQAAIDPARKYTAGQPDC
ncbi:ATP-dependent zinc protease [Stutzerimonas kirkiae]|uniref:ATP-dependent zinc protease n=1 Tax=Stutzerimonas kirkiae TaxID=2211392 RepID=A0A4Q9R5K7_9GAMM|nr:ATP-dependent zinc protease [Stutzerimonas kirkiae]TBU94083.1 ATP-dependent zinc protease [Stutzerimonas kirkiae]TBV05004.1 ATP-dependent zinc protease [Stutzerimonas kirkiae]TBV06402.1 ATP-dependent zinc protease [Stutzerimonas kirkiae]TBV13785.1 ATP-dependent zinc protease [Stutzerimonas kirkiae]